MTDPVSGSVRIGTYALEVGTFTESYAAFKPDREDQKVKALRDAFAEETDELPRSVAALEELQEDAQAVTAKIERAHELFRAAAEGRLLEADPLVAEVDSLLGLARWLDRDGRFEEELRLLRALHGLLVLARRWLDLIRGLRRGLSAAEEAGDLAAQAWVRHELGSLHLCADDSEAAVEQLGQALRLQQRLGQATGTCATRHNLDSAQRDLATRAASKPWSRRLLRLAVVAGVLTPLAVAGTTIALAQGDDSPSVTAPTSTNGTDTTIPSTTGTSSTGTSETTDATTPSTTSTVDATAPIVTLLTPPDGSIIQTPTPEFSGTAGIEAGDTAEVLVEVLDESGRPSTESPLRAPVVDDAWTVKPTVALPDGSYRATASQSDAARNTGSSTTVTFTVDTAAPELKLTCLDVPDSLDIECTLTSTDAGTASIEPSWIPCGSKDVTLEDSQTVELDPDGTFTLTRPEQSLQEFNVVTSQSDAAGNTASSTAQLFYGCVD